MRSSAIFITRLMMSLLGTALCLHASEDLRGLLNDYAQKADLSNRTKQEAAGNLIVYTRQDLDRMQIKQLKELLAQLPFLHYKEDNFGLSNPFYTSYQPDSPLNIRLYINEHALEDPYGGNALQGYAQMDMSYIDHVEIYMGAPALYFGAQQGAYVIKLYTKDPERENTDVAGFYGGSYGTGNFYGYTARVTGDGLKYLFYADYMNLKRKKISFHGSTLGRDKKISHFYGQIGQGAHRVEVEAYRTRFDHFYGHSFRIDPLHGYPYSHALSLYAGYYYRDENGWQGFVNAALGRIHYIEKSRSPIGFIPTRVGYIPYNNLDEHFNDLMIDSQLRKRFHWDRWDNETGIQIRYKNFRFSDLSINDRAVPDPNRKDHETIYALFNETGYQPDPNNILLLSFKATRYQVAERFNDRTDLFGRFGYIYNSENWTFKNFIEGGDFIPDLRYLYANVHDFFQTEKLESTTAYAVTSELIRKQRHRKLSFLLSASELQNLLYFRVDVTKAALPRYDTFDKPIRLYNARIHYRDRLDESNTLALSVWGTHTRNFNDDSRTDDVGAQIAHDLIVSAWTLHNDLIYHRFHSYRATWNWNMALTRSFGRNLSLYLKGENLLNKAEENRYFAVDPTPLMFGRPPVITRLDHVDPFDRRVWIGLEYQF